MNGDVAPAIYCPPTESALKAEPCAIVLFGATGDLTRRKLIPALYSLWLQKLLPEKYALVAFARRPKTDDEFRADLRDSVDEFAKHLPTDGDEWRRFTQSIFYHHSTLDDTAGYALLKERLDGLDRDLGLNGNRLFYLATPPENFSEIVQHLGASGLTRKSGGTDGWTRIVVEKPFGSDLESARELNRVLRNSFDEPEIYRIDHYLGKETVQNILVLRFANRLFELLWNHLYIDNVQITVAETIGVEGRGAYFDEAGIIRDIIQNHALQVLTLIAMEPPVDLQADAVRDEKVKVLRSIRPMNSRDTHHHALRAQYMAEGGVGGYREEEGVPPESRTETYAAMRFWVDNWRWAGVPFYIRAGKRLNQRVTKVVLELREVPDVLFSRLACAEVTPNRITIRIQPNEGVEILMSAKEPGPSMIVSPVRMHFSYAEAFGKAIPEAYERLLLNAMLGDASLFARDDEVETAWNIVAPLLIDSQNPPDTYAAGSWGPESADRLLSIDGRRWWND